MVTVCPQGRHIGVSCIRHRHTPAWPIECHCKAGWATIVLRIPCCNRPPARAPREQRSSASFGLLQGLHVWCSMVCVVSGYGGFVSTVAGACGSVLLDVRVSQPLHNRRSICNSSLLAPPSTKPKYYRKAPPVQCRHRCSLSYCELRCLVYIPMLCVAFLGAGGSVARCGEAFLRAASRHHRRVPQPQPQSGWRLTCAKQ